MPCQFYDSPGSVVKGTKPGSSLTSHNRLWRRNGNITLEKGHGVAAYVAAKKLCKTKRVGMNKK